MRYIRMYVWLSLLTVIVNRGAGAAERVDFNRDVRPILSAKCFRCHGPDEKTRQGDLRFDVSDSPASPFHDRDGSFVIKPGDLQASSMWHRLTTSDEDVAMPPADSQIPPLTAAEQELIRRWIEQGAKYDVYWAFVAPRAQPLPKTEDTDWSRNRIDRFVAARLEREGLHPQQPADRRTLIRRLTFDLTGLPPTRDEIRQFLRDDSPGAEERLIDRLLASPRYGEHMAKYWLDLVRFADTNGIHHDHYREMTPYRDWVIRAFNDNLRFASFIVDQLAGDLHENPSIDQLIASGFNRLHLVIDKGTALPEESFTRNVIDRVTAVGTAFMGLTVGCAVCHDHKYDPITQRDFYQLYAFFNNIDAEPETPGRNVHPPLIRLPSPAQRQRLIALNERISAATAQLESLPASPVPNTENTGSAEAVNEQRQQVAAELEALQKQKADLEGVIPVSLIMKEREEIRPAHVLVRGVYDQLGERVQRNTPAFLPPLSTEKKVKSRMDLARWLTNKKHPLTARVTVNRFWQQFFGVGLVKTAEDFGTQGQWPSHPGLLDDLATTFVDADWDVKRFIRLIVCSQTYRQSSQATLSAFRTDAENRLLARGSRFRLDAEMIRDQILFVCGLLSETMYGKSVKPPQPPDLWKNVSMVSSSTYAFEADEGENIHRRSLYTFWKRALPPPQMTIFDAPTREACTARRERTNTPLQALVLMNEGQYFRATRHLARVVLTDATKSDEQCLQELYESITSHLPDQVELSTLQAGLQSLRTTYSQDVQSARIMTSDVEGLDDAGRIELAAHTMLINSLFNLDVAKTRE